MVLFAEESERRNGHTAFERKVVLTPASAITPRPVTWLWQDRLAAGTLALAAGREGTGKSQWAAWLAAQITRGTLRGTLEGRPRPVFYAAFEDSWEHTLVPRLIAAGADLHLVYRVAVELIGVDTDTVLSLPADLDQLERQIVDYGAGLLVPDPLLSTIHGSLDTHKNRDMRQVLDPLVAMADRTGCTVLGVAHFNKSSNGDASSAIVGSGAFKDVPRAVFSFARDDETGERVFSQSKNSLGSCDLPSLAYRIEPVEVPTPTGPAHVSRLTWEGESARTVADLMRDAGTSPEERGALEDAEEWLEDLLAGGPVRSDEVFAKAKGAGHSERTLKRAKKRLAIRSERIAPEHGEPYWQWLPPAKSAKGSKNPTRGSVGPVGPLASCDPCGALAERLIREFNTDRHMCPGCCVEVAG